MFQIKKKIFIKRTMSAIAHNALGAVGIPAVCTEPELMVGFLV